MTSKAHLKRYYKLLDFINNSDRNLDPFTKSLFQSNSVPPDLIKCIEEVCHNILIGNIPLSLCDKKQLRPFARTIKQLGDTKVGKQKKRRLLKNQRGGLLRLLLGPALKLISNILGVN